MGKTSKRERRTKRAKLQKAAFSFAVFLFMMICGLVGGYLIGHLNKEVFRSKGISVILFSTAALLCVIGLWWLLHLYLHEVGHLLFGLATGYCFQSIRFGSLMIVKNADGLKLKKYTLAGTGGQCLMLPPKEDMQGNYPTGLYNWGGCLMNLIVSAICFAGWFCIGKESVPAICLLLGGMLGIGTALMNGIPLSSLANDGYNATILRKSKEARMAFRCQLLMNDEMLQGKRLSELPEEWFVLGETCQMDNALTTSTVVLCFSRLMETRQFEEAKQLGQHILDEAEELADVHELMVKAELLFMEILRCEDTAKAKQMYEKDKKSLMVLKNMPSMQRILYAYYLCIEKDVKKAEQAKAQFEKLAKHYPNPTELADERELIKLAEERAGELSGSAEA